MRQIRSPMNDSEYLSHYGVLGMKWGVRKKRPTSGGKKTSSKTTSKKTKPKKKKFSEMTDQELDAYISRQEKIRRARTVSKQNQSTAKRIVSEASQTALRNALTSTMTKTGEYFLAKMVNSAVGDTVISTNKDKKDKDKDKDKGKDKDKDD